MILSTAPPLRVSFALSLQQYVYHWLTITATTTTAMCSRWNKNIQETVQSFVVRLKNLGRNPANAAARIRSASSTNARVLGSVGSSQSQNDVASLTAFFNYVDANKDGYISPDEINEAMAVDFDHNGTIEEWEKVKAGKQWLDTFFAGQNANYDRLISLDELLKWNERERQ